MNVKQCRLRQGGTETTAWIDERGARVGCEVELLVKPNPEWWTVTEVYPYTRDADELHGFNALNRGSLPSIVKPS